MKKAAILCRCGGRMRAGVCNRCGPRWRRDHRPSPWRRGYANDWIKLRKYKLKLNPECEDCLREGRIWPATEVHHILKIADRPDLRLDQETDELV